MSDGYLVVRLNSETTPVSVEERNAIAATGARLTEIEGDKDDDIVAAAAEADAVMLVSAYLRGPVISRMARCRVISRLGTGTDKIDVAEATSRGIPVANVPDFCTGEVADHAMALLLAAARRIKECDREMRQGRQPKDMLQMRRLSTLTVGILGLGRIGRSVAERAAAFGMKRIACDVNTSAEQALQLGVELVDFAELLAKSDYLVVTCPLTESTRRMIGRDQLRRMKSSAVLVNVGRGEIVDETQLATALREGVIRYACLDVFGEINVFQAGGFPTDHPLFDLPNVLLTPHVAACSRESIGDCLARGARAVVDVLQGRMPPSIVNPEVQPWWQE